mgnify:CR=1 FL=1
MSDFSDKEIEDEYISRNREFDYHSDKARQLLEDLYELSKRHRFTSFEEDFLVMILNNLI